MTYFTVLDTAQVAEQLGIPEAELLANWEAGAAKQRAEEREWKNPQRRGRRVGLKLYKFLPDDDLSGEVTNYGAGVHEQ